MSSTHVVRKRIEIFSERTANAHRCEPEILRLVGVLPSRGGLILGRPLAEGIPRGLVEVQPGVVVHSLGDPDRSFVDFSLSHIDEPVLAQHRPGREGPAHSVEKVLEDLRPDGVWFECGVGEPPPAGGQNHAAGGRHRGHGITMGHDESGFRVMGGELG